MKIYMPVDPLVCLNPKIAAAAELMPRKTEANVLVVYMALLSLRWTGKREDGALTTIESRPQAIANRIAREFSIGPRAVQTALDALAQVGAIEVVEDEKAADAKDPVETQPGTQPRTQVGTQPGSQLGTTHIRLTGVRGDEWKTRKPAPQADPRPVEPEKSAPSPQSARPLRHDMTRERERDHDNARARARVSDSSARAGSDDETAAIAAELAKVGPGGWGRSDKHRLKKAAELRRWGYGAETAAKLRARANERGRNPGGLFHKMTESPAIIDQSLQECGADPDGPVTLPEEIVGRFRRVC